MDLRTYRRTDGQKISPFYKTTTPALPPHMKTKEKVEQGKRTADHLMPLGDWFSRRFTVQRHLQSDARRVC